MAEKPPYLDAACTICGQPRDAAVHYTHGVAYRHAWSPAVVYPTSKPLAFLYAGLRDASALPPDTVPIPRSELDALRAIREAANTAHALREDSFETSAPFEDAMDDLARALHSVTLLSQWGATPQEPGCPPPSPSSPPTSSSGSSSTPGSPSGSPRASSSDTEPGTGGTRG